MATTCSSCGTTRNVPGTTICIVCGSLLPTSGGAFSASATPRPATLTVSGGRTYNLSPSSPTLIGSRGSAILLSGAGVQPQHARIQATGSGYQIEPVNGTVLVNGSTISSAVTLPSGATITLGSVSLTYHGPAATPPSAPIPLAVSSASALVTSPPVFAASTSPSISPPAPSSASTTPTPDLTGHILVVDGPHQEEPDKDPAGLVLRGCLSIFILPFLCWQPGLLVPFLLYGVMSNRDRNVPVRYLRVADSSGTPYSVKMKGEPVRGMLSHGDDASFWGKWDGGTLVMEHARNHSTNAEVILKPVVQRRRSKYLLTAAIIVTFVFFIWIELSY